MGLLLRIVLVMGWMVFFTISPAFAKNYTLKKYPHKIIGILGPKQTKNWIVDDPSYNRFRKYVFTLYKKPDKESHAYFRLTPNEMQTADYYYNRPGVVAYGFEELDWYRVFYKDQFYWVQLPSDMKLHSYVDLLKDRKAYLKEWDWKVYSRPGEEKVYEIKKNDVKILYKGNPAIEVVTSEEINGRLWLRIRVMDSNCYELDRPGLTLASGWLPAYTPDNRTTFWFNSRDCAKEGY